MKKKHINYTLFEHGRFSFLTVFPVREPWSSLELALAHVITVR